MSDLEEVFGDEFASHIQERTAERRQERNALSDAQMAEIAHLAINEGKFEEGDPQFTYTSDNGLAHTVMLVQVPDPDEGEVWEHLSEPWDGAAKLPLDYLGQWYWSVFPNKKDVQKLEQGMHAIVAGAIEENEGDKGETYYNIYPVRGVLTLKEAKEKAESWDGDADFETEEPDEDFESGSSSDDEEDEDDSSSLDFESDDSDDSSGGGLDGLMDDAGDDEEEEAEDEEPVPYEEIAAKVEELAEMQAEDEEPKVFEIEEGTEALARLTTVVANQLDLDNEDGVQDVVADVISEHRDEEEEDEDDTNKLF